MPNNERIRVLQITANLGIGGLERVVANLCLHLDPRIFDVSVCCLRFKGDFGEELEGSNIPVYLLPQVTSGPDYTAFFRLRRILRQLKPHIVHSHNTNSFIDTTLAGIGLPIPVRINTDHARKFPGRLKDRLIEGICARFVDHFIAVTEETRTNLIKYERIAPHKLLVINNGIDGSLYNRDIDIARKKKELGVTDCEPIIGLGVRLTPQKGIIHLIHAAPAILERYPRTVFLIAGKGPLQASLKREAERNGLADSFRFLGPRLDLADILKILDIYVLPSEWEGLPLALLEAMAAGCCIVATKVGGVPLAVEDGQSGSLVEPLDPASLSAAVLNLLQDGARRKELSAGARVRFEKEFSIARMIKDHEKLYLNLLRNKGGK